MSKLLLVVFFLTTNALAANLNLNDLKITDLVVNLPQFDGHFFNSFSGDNPTTGTEHGY